MYIYTYMKHVYDMSRFNSNELVRFKARIKIEKKNNEDWVMISPSASSIFFLLW